MRAHSVLWLHPPVFTAKQKSAVDRMVHRAGLDFAGFYYICPTRLVKNVVGKYNRGAPQFNEEARPAVEEILDRYIESVRPNLIVINDELMLQFIARGITLAAARGSIFQYKSVPCLVMDTVQLIHTKHWGQWCWVQDLQKLKRWLLGEQRAQPKFSYSVLETVEQVIEFKRELLENGIIIAEDIETSGIKISCIGFSYLHRSGKIVTGVIPFINPLRPGAIHWETVDDEVCAWEAVKEINACDIPKVFQNGAYDCSYFLSYRIPVKNWLYDTMHLWHSIWMDAPKKLGFITSHMLDYYTYWKDEAKDDSDDQAKASRIPKTYEGYVKYLRYNAQDCYYTLCDLFYLLKFYEAQPFIRDNYNIEFRAQVGPAMMMTFTGMRVNEYRRGRLIDKWEKEAEQKKWELQTMTNNPDFNPGSNEQGASFLYDVLGATPIKVRGKGKGKKATERPMDEKALKFVKLQHPLFARVIDDIWAYKKPMNNISKYGKMILKAHRFYYSISAGGTNTGRYASKKHMFGYGNQAQNVPFYVRQMMVADDGYFFLEPDYSQSDAWFIAYESQDPKYMQNISDDRDTHCVHAEFFFSKPYETILQATKAEEDWAVHPITGVRQNTKRIVHGANYLMQGGTLYVTMGHEAVIATAVALNMDKPHLWTRKQCEAFCQSLIDMYFSHLYPRLPVWQKEIVKEAVENGNLITLHDGRTRLFLGNIEGDHAIQRELASFYGQGGTASNINRAINTIYYRTDILQSGARIVTQTHDSCLFAIPVEKWFLGQKIIDIMKEPVTIKGAEISIPVDAKCGFTWGGKGATRKWINSPDIIKLMVENENKFRSTINEPPLIMSQLSASLKQLEGVTTNG